MYFPLQLIKVVFIELGEEDSFLIQFFFILGTLLEVYIWLAIGKFLRNKLEIRNLEPIIAILSGIIILSALFQFLSQRNQIPILLVEGLAVGKAGLYIVLAILFTLIHDHYIPFKYTFATLLAITQSLGSILIFFQGYPWHGVEMALAITFFILNCFLMYYFYQVIHWATRFDDQFDPVESLIEKIGGKPVRE